MGLTPTTTKEDIYRFTGYRDDGLRKESPLNGAWDGSVVASDANDKTDYRCTLHLFDHGNELQAELLLRKSPTGSGSIYTGLRGTCTNDRQNMELLRKDTINIVRGGLESKLEAYQVLELRFEDGDPPSLHGICAAIDRDVTVKLGEIQLVRRGFYDPPPLP